MKRLSVFRIALSALFTVAVLMSVSVREIHYLYASHADHEHCENHLHSSEHHHDCQVCKFDISSFTDDILPIDLPVTVQPLVAFAAADNGILLPDFGVTCFLRGPPKRA